MLNPRFVVLDRQEQDVPRGLIDFNIEINDIWNDIIRYIPEELDLMLNIFSRFQDLNDKAQNKSKDCYVIYMPMLTSDPKMLIDVCNIVLLDVEDVLTPEFVIYRKKVISSLNKLRKAICRCVYINKLRYALEYYNAFLVRLGFERVYRKNFIADAHKILDVYFDKGHLPNVTPDAVQTPIDKDVEKFCKKLTKIIDWHLDKHQSNLIRKTTVRISHSKKCDAYEIDSTLLKKVVKDSTDISFRKFLNELTKRYILIKNNANSNQPRFVFQRTVNSKPQYYYVVRAEVVGNSEAITL